MDSIATVTLHRFVAVTPQLHLALVTTVNLRPPLWLPHYESSSAAPAALVVNSLLHILNRAYFIFLYTTHVVLNLMQNLCHSYAAPSVQEQVVVRTVQREVIRYKTVRRTDRNTCRAAVYQHISSVSNEWRTTLNNDKHRKLFQYFVTGMSSFWSCTILGLLGRLAFRDCDSTTHGRVALDTPVLVISLQLSSVGPGWYLRG